MDNFTDTQEVPAVETAPAEQATPEQPTQSEPQWIANPEVTHLVALADQVVATAEAYRAGTVNLSQVQDLADAIKASAERL